MNLGFHFSFLLSHMYFVVLTFEVVEVCSVELNWGRQYV